MQNRFRHPEKLNCACSKFKIVLFFNLYLKIASRKITILPTIMKKNYFKKLTVFVLIAAIFVSASQVFSQKEDGGQSQKRNHLPNPKIKKTTDRVVEIGISGSQKVEKEPATDIVAEQKVEADVVNAPAEADKPAEGESSANKLIAVAKDRNRSSRVVNKLPTELYRIGSGDTLDIRLLNAATKESSLFTVLDNGIIDYPLAGEEPISVIGLTTDEVKDILTDKIKLYENPEVSVGVRSYGSHKITVLGLVEKQGEKTLRREAVPFYVIISEAIPNQVANRAMIVRTDKQSLELDLTVQADLDTLVFPGDIIKISYVAKAASEAQTQQFYYISGNIASAGEKSFRPGLTLVQAVMANGNVTKSASKATIFRQNEAGLLVASEYNIKHILEGKIPDVTLQAGDRVEIKR